MGRRTRGRRQRTPSGGGFLHNRMYAWGFRTSSLIPHEMPGFIVSHSFQSVCTPDHLHDGEFPTEKSTLVIRRVCLINYRDFSPLATICSAKISCSDFRTCQHQFKVTTARTLAGEKCQKFHKADSGNDWSMMLQNKRLTSGLLICLKHTKQTPERCGLCSMLCGQNAFQPWILRSIFWTSLRFLY